MPYSDMIFHLEVSMLQSGVPEVNLTTGVSHEHSTSIIDCETIRVHHIEDTSCHGCRDIEIQFSKNWVRGVYLRARGNVFVSDAGFRPQDQAKSLIVEVLIVINVIFVRHHSSVLVKDAYSAEWDHLTIRHLFRSEHPESDTRIVTRRHYNQVTL